MPRKFFKKLGQGIKKAAVGVARVGLPMAKNLLTSKARMFAGAVNPAIDRRINSSLNNLSNSLISKISGHGDYTTSIQDIRHNTLIRPTTDDNIPQFGMIKGGIRVQHREYLGDLKSSGTFKNNVYRVNPALAETFPWLSQLASNFERYRFLGLCFEFKSGSSDALNSTNTALGYVIMASQYNSLASPFLNKQQMENTQYCVSVKPSKSVIHPIECDPSLAPSPVLYTRLATVGDITAGDIRLYDHCQEEIAVVGMQQDDVNLGELWISYDVMLYLPVLNNGLAFDYKTQHIGMTVMNSGSTTYHPVGRNQFSCFDNLGGTLDQLNNRYYFPIGTNGLYLINISWKGQKTGGEAAQEGLNILEIDATTHCSLVNLYASQDPEAFRAEQPIFGWQANGDGNLQQFSAQYCVRIPNPNLLASVRFKSPDALFNSLDEPCIGDFIVTQVNGNLTNNLTPIP